MIKPKDAVSWTLLFFCAAAPVSIAGLNLAAGALTAALLWAWFAGAGAPWRAAKNPLVYALIAYVAVAAICSAFGVAPETSFAMLYKDLHKLWLLALLLVALSWTRPKRAYAALGLGLVLISVVGIGQVLFLRTGDLVYSEVRARGFVHPVTFGEIVALLWLGGLCLRLKREGTGLSREGLSLVLGVAGLAFLLNQTRGAFLGLAAGLLAVALADRRLRKLAAVVALACPLLLIVWEMLPTGHTFLQMIVRMHDPGPNPYLERLTLWKVGFQIFRDQPFLGVGPGNYRTVYPQYFHGVSDNENAWGSAHDLYIHQAAERGLLGLAALAAVLWTMTARAAARARRTPDEARLWALGACVAFLVMNLTEVAFQNEQATSLLLFIWAWAETA